MNVKDFGICVNTLTTSRKQTQPVSNQTLTDRAAAETALLWDCGDRIKVRFLNGMDAQRDAVKRVAPEWCESANLSFDFAPEGLPDITINFAPIDGLYYGVYNSLVGKASRGRVPSMNLTFPPGTTDEVVLRRYILHEFGHALGLIHEHQSPALDFHWNERVVLDWFHERVGWDEDMVRAQVLTPYQTETTTNTQFDPRSIMLYPIYPGWASSGRVTGWNNDLSDTDRLFIGTLYPKACSDKRHGPTGDVRP